MTWTLQYDPNTPATLNNVPLSSSYAPASPVISNLVDQTTGFHFSTPSATSLQSGLTLFNAPQGGFLSAGDTQMSSNQGPLYQALLSLLGPSNGFSTLDLSQLPLDQAGIQMTAPYGAASILSYYGIPAGDGGVQLSFTVQVASLSAVSTPEPGSLTLFVLGAVGLVARRIHSRLRRGGGFPFERAVERNANVR